MVVGMGESLWRVGVWEFWVVGFSCGVGFCFCLVFGGSGVWTLGFVVILGGSGIGVRRDFAI